jgi:uncharacterized membrane-anchored protein YjiN (DUF445 family)
MSYKQKANITLALVFLMFVFSAVCKHFWPQLLAVNFSYYVFEAALIGGIADWFAVTALFRKPLNWPYHTALLPRNREKVIDSVSNIVQNDLLNANIIRFKIEQINLSKKLFELFEKNGQLQYLIRALTRRIVDWLNSFKPGTAAALLTPLLSRNLLKLQLGPLTKDFILHNLNNGQVDSWLETAILKLEKIAGQDKTRIFICNFLQDQKNEKVSQGFINNFIVALLEKTGGLNLQEAAASMQLQLIATIKCLKDKEHPLRHTVREILRQTASELEQDFLIRDSLEAWKTEIIAKIPLNNLLENIIRALQEGTEDYDKSVIKAYLEEILEAAWLFFRNNNLLSAKINSYLHTALSELLEYNQTFIGDIARDALAKLTNEDLIKFIEDKAGNDLQWIRINGSIIGGLVGIILFMFLRFIYEPYVVPLFSGLFV